MSQEAEPVKRAVEAVAPADRTLERFDTGVPNLDLVLGGGSLRGTVVMVIGPPGSGTTILAQQIAFPAAARIKAVLYFTGYSEMHDKLLAHNRSLAYFAPEAIGAELQMGSLPDLLAQRPDQAKTAIIDTARKQRASLVVLDGFRSIRGFRPMSRPRQSSFSHSGRNWPCSARHFWCWSKAMPPIGFATPSNRCATSSCRCIAWSEVAATDAKSRC
jgi:predicted ATP-dependent serine protease